MSQVVPATNRAETPSSDRTSVSVKLNYGLGMLGISLVQISVSTLLIYYYTDVLGISPVQAGAILFMGTALDAAAEFGAAALASRTRTRLGKYRPYLIYASVPLGLTFALMFLNPGLPAWQLFPLALAVHLVFRLTYALVSMPHMSLISRLSSDADERAKIGGVKAFFAATGSLTSAYLGLSLVSWLGGGDEQKGFLYFGMIFGGASALAILACGLMAREQESATDGVGADTSALVSAMRLMLKNGQLLLMLASTLVFFVAYMIWQSSVIYYFKYFFGDATQARVALTCIAVGAMISPPLWSRLTLLTSKRTVWIAGCVLIAASLCTLYVFDRPSMLQILLIYTAMGAGKSAVIMNYFAMLADAIDYGEWRFGARVEAYSFGVLSLVTKAGMATGGAVLGLLLKSVGFQGEVSVSEETIEGIRLIACIGPSILMLGSAGTIALFSITASRHRAMRAEIVQRRAKF